MNRLIKVATNKPVRFGLEQVLASATVLVTRVARILPANISPLGTFGFFGGNPLLFFSSIIVFDYFVGGFYQGLIFTYLGFAAYPLIGYLGRRWGKGNWKVLAVLLPVASFLFFSLSNLGVWWYWYPRTLEGLVACFTLALPFYQRTLLGDLAFGYSFLIVSRLKTKVVGYAFNRESINLDYSA